MKKISYIIISIITIFLATYGPKAFSDSLKIFGNSFKPPKYYLEDRIPKGILVDIMRYTEKETGVSFDIELYPWRRAYTYALQNKGGIIGLSKNQGRLKTFDYSDVMYYDELMLVVIKGKEFNFESIADLKGKIIGVQTGASFGDAFEQAKNTVFNTEEDNGQVLRLKKLLKGRIDVALIGPGKAGVNQVIKHDETLFRNKDKFVILSKPFKRDPNFLGFSKDMKMEALLKEFNRALNKGHEDGTIQKIIEKYMKQTSEKLLKK